MTYLIIINRKISCLV